MSKSRWDHEPVPNVLGWRELPFDISVAEHDGYIVVLQAVIVQGPVVPVGYRAAIRRPDGSNVSLRGTWMTDSGRTFGPMTILDAAKMQARRDLRRVLGEQPEDEDWQHIGYGSMMATFRDRHVVVAVKPSDSSAPHVRAMAINSPAITWKESIPQGVVDQGIDAVLNFGKAMGIEAILRMSTKDPTG